MLTTTKLVTVDESELAKVDVAALRNHLPPIQLEELGETDDAFKGWHLVGEIIKKSFVVSGDIDELPTLGDEILNRLDEEGVAFFSIGEEAEALGLAWLPFGVMTDGSAVEHVTAVNPGVWFEVGGKGHHHSPGFGVVKSHLMATSPLESVMEIEGGNKSLQSASLARVDDRQM